MLRLVGVDRKIQSITLLARISSWGTIYRSCPICLEMTPLRVGVYRACRTSLQGTYRLAEVLCSEFKRELQQEAIYFTH